MSEETRILSVTEMGVFLQCRQKWWLTSPSAHGLQAKGFPAQPLVLGTLVHAGLAAHATGQDWQMAVLTSAGEYSMNVQHDSDRERVDFCVSEACAWITDYIEHYGRHPFDPAQVEAAEQSFVLDIAEPHTGVALGQLVGTFDYVLSGENGEVYIADTKTYAPQNRPSQEKYMLDLQFNTYAWACRELFGRCDGIIYDGIEKKHPARFERFILRPDDATMRSVSMQVRRIFQEAFSDDFYPLRLLGYECARCPVRDLCYTSMAGEDMEYLADHKYTRDAGGSRSRGAVRGQAPVPVSSLSELPESTS